ncbi:MAG TPA: D-glycerate dehydrogenase [Nitrososphaeraceae archaeon]|nr:D-glycerate dehydrogenase [Nitrososphaeraceae archaeon]
MKKKVYVTRLIPEPALSILSKECDTTVNKKPNPPTKKEILSNIRGMDAILCTLSDTIDREIMDAAGPNLKVISSYSTGYDHIDIEEANRRGIYVAYTSDILTESTADLTFALILSLARRVVEADKFVRKKLWKYGWMPKLFLGSDVNGMTLGIFGLGRIGSAVARRAKGFNMKILYHNRHRIINQLDDPIANYVDINKLLKESDFLSIHANLNKHSFHFFNEAKFRKMKNTAFVINTSRGQIIDQRALIKALRNRWIAGAGLDVYEKEPICSSNALLRMNNVIILPHIGSATYQTRSKMARVAAENLLNILNGKEPLHLVNPQILKQP